MAFLFFSFPGLAKSSLQLLRIFREGHTLNLCTLHFLASSNVAVSPLSVALSAAVAAPSTSVFVQFVGALCRCILSFIYRQGQFYVTFASFASGGGLFTSKDFE